MIQCVVCLAFPAVGHAHPRVAEAVAKQMTTIACSTLYLHENVIKYAEHLRTKVPGDLSIFHFTNSGCVYLHLHFNFVGCVTHERPCILCRSEANDLALRIAKDVTGGSVVIALQK